MKRTAFLILFVMITLFVLAMPALAQEPAPVETPYVSPPPGAAPEFSLPPEFVAWAQVIAVRGGWLALVVIIDLFLGVVCALKGKTFQWQRLADFLADYGSKIVGWLSLEALGLLPAEYAAMAGLAAALGVGAYAIILISGVGSILTNAQGLGLLPAGVPGVKPQG